jgi:hypothetical protein
MNLSAQNPNFGPNVDKWGKRFYDCSNVYDLNMTNTFHKICKKTLAGKRTSFKSNIMFMSHAKPFASVAEVRFSESFKRIVNNDCRAITNQGYGEVMSMRQMDFDSTIKSCFIGVVAHRCVSDNP